jgi:DNA-directed RNA polymerase specialized sigma24 family protein
MPVSWTSPARRGTEEMAALPTIEEAYTRYQGLMFSALARLARQGFVVPPSEALDLIHDFFAEHWEPLASRYDPSKAALGTYLFAAFVRFARPRIVRLMRARSSLQDMEQLESHSLAEATDTGAERESGFDAMRVAISSIPIESRQVLEDFLATPALSVRHLARTRSISRVKAREALLMAVGQLVSVMGRPEGIPKDDWHVAIAQWKEGRTQSETAGVLGKTVQEVRAAQHRNVAYLGQCLASLRRRGRP